MISKIHQEKGYVASQSDYKQELLELSERLVDISEELDRLHKKPDEKSYAALHRELRKHADRLLEVMDATEGDDHAFAGFAMGSLCSMMGYRQQAEKSYRSALDHWPDHVGILNELFDCLMEQHKYADAKKVIEQSIRHGGETPVILQNYAVVLDRLDRTEEACIVMINCLARFPGDPRSREMLEQLEIKKQEAHQ